MFIVGVNESIDDPDESIAELVRVLIHGIVVADRIRHGISNQNIEDKREIFLGGK